MNKVFDYNGAQISHSRPVKQLKTVKKMLVVDSGDRDVQKYPYNGDFVVYLPRVYENVVSLRLAGAEFPASPVTKSGGSLGTPLYYIVDLEGLNKMDECSVGADRSGYPDGMYAKIPVEDPTKVVLYNDHSQPENIAHYTPAVGKLDRMRVRTRLHSQKQTTDFIKWNSGELSLTFEIEMLDNVFDDFSSFESRIADRA
jgi:hypothetical protein